MCSLEYQSLCYPQAAKLGKYAMPPFPCKNPSDSSSYYSAQTGQQETGTHTRLFSSCYTRQAKTKK